MKQLRHYQQECIDKVFETLYEKNKNNTFVTLPTGSGKTIIQAKIVGECLNKNSKNRILYLCHKIYLLNSFYNTLISIGIDPSLISYWNADIKDSSNQITLMSMLSAAQNFKTDFNHFELIVVDEAHHIHMSYNTYQKLLSKHADKSKHELIYNKIVGFSATYIPLSDKLRNKSFFFDNICYSKTYIELKNQKYLSGINYTLIKTNFSFKKERKVSKIDTTNISNYLTSENDITKLYKIEKKLEQGEYLKEDLERLNNKKRNEFILKVYFDNIKKYKKTVIFCPSISTIKSLQKLISKKNITGFYTDSITAFTKEKDRELIIKNFENSEYGLLLNFEVMIEGVDIPLTDTIFITRPTKSKRIYIQMIGRGTRRIENLKETVNIVDFIDDNSVFFKHLCEKWRIEEFDETPTQEYKTFVRKKKEEYDILKRKEEEVVRLKNQISKYTDKNVLNNRISKIENISHLVLIKSNYGEVYSTLVNEKIRDKLKKLYVEIKENPDKFVYKGFHDKRFSILYWSFCKIDKTYFFSVNQFYWFIKNCVTIFNNNLIWDNYNDKSLNRIISLNQVNEKNEI